ncbi:malate synthase G [Devosia sp.]|uniref:malate synthase G n=1 Tax=Devosia sp. TaxID=1871048 RepID=UPI002F06573C
MSAAGYRHVAGLSVHPALSAFVEEEVLPFAGVAADHFWSGLAAIVTDLTPRFHELLGTRAELQARLDDYHRAGKGAPHDPVAYEAFLREIGYLVPEPAPDAYRVATKNVDAEIAILAAPQLVVPLSNARYALNAANARWGSLYDALYGTDALGRLPKPGDGIDDEQMSAVFAYVGAWLDAVFPLASGSHADVTAYVVDADRLLARFADGTATPLRDNGAFAGFRGPRHEPTALLLVNNRLHVELAIDREHPVGRRQAAGVADIVVEAAASVIMDMEDAVAAVDADDKVAIYRNWLGLMAGTLSARVTKPGDDFERTLASDRHYTAPDGASLTLHGRAVMLIRHVGPHMFTDAVLDAEGNPIPEGILDAAVTIACALPDIAGRTPVPNSRTGSVYVVKPKMHGPDEVGLADALFRRIEELYGLARYTMKIGVMDEERRTSVNLAACLSKVRDRTVFINTGFLDRTGDEIHSVMEAGPVVRKGDMMGQPWLSAYEHNNVDVGLARNLPGRAQIGKGMWAAPDRMQAMLAQKGRHPGAGASTAWVPTPTAAVLHVLHYHQVNVRAVQQRLREGIRSRLPDLLTPPVAAAPLGADAITEELRNNLQGVLGYVVRWIDQGIGCSTVPDLGGVRLMEDRATVRISTQHVANWLHHGIVDEPTVRETMRAMAQVVDEQNKGEPGYIPMSPGFDTPAFRAAEELIFEGRDAANGYTEAVLHKYRRMVKRSRAGAAGTAGA